MELLANIKISRKEPDSKYDDYGHTKQIEKVFFNNKLNILLIHEWLSKLDLNKTQMDYDAISLYLSAMWDENSVFPRIESGYRSEPHMNDILVYDFIN